MDLFAERSFMLVAACRQHQHAPSRVHCDLPTLAWHPRLPARPTVTLCSAPCCTLLHNTAMAYVKGHDATDV
eukprot:14684085-Alexandrium_andersonii.AAC.1